jgi:hypothetical protein
MRILSALKTSSLARCRQGLASVEFAILTPMLALMLVGTIDLGLAYVNGQELEDAAHSGTQRVLHDPLSASDTTTVELMGLEEYYDRSISSGEIGALPVTANARNFCGCPDGNEVSCGTTCSGGEGAGTFVELTMVGTSNMTLSYPFTGKSSVTLTRTSIVRVE